MSNGAPNPIFGMTIMNGFLYVGGVSLALFFLYFMFTNQFLCFFQTFTQVGNINAKVSQFNFPKSKKSFHLFQNSILQNGTDLFGQQLVTKILLILELWNLFHLGIQ